MVIHLKRIDIFNNNKLFIYFYSKLSTSTICKKCEQNVKSYGKPTACEYCNIIAAFIGNKCQRCTNSEIKYGPPVTCEQCKQKCAFDRKDDDKKVDGKLLCWLCTLSFKRALAKTKQSESDRRAHMKMAAQRAAKNKEPKLRSHNKRPQRVDVTKINANNSSDGNQNDNAGGIGLGLPPQAKLPRTRPPGDALDPNSSDHVVAMTQLKEQMASLQKQLMQKDSMLLTKDKMITELKANHFTIEQELRNKMNSSQKDHDKKVEVLHSKIKTLQKEVATLSKSGKKGNNISSSGANSGSGTDSPSLS
uniref:Protein FAM76A n=1 Tax=Clastoptera arizonana TaxID=38151 RepID=A0A1B6DAV2_9HEMI